MSNFLSKRLLCGVLATSFLLINCQKAPNREVKPGGPMVDKKGAPVAQLAECSIDMLSLIEARATSEAEIEKILAEANQPVDPAAKDGAKKGLDDAQKASLDKLISKLAADSDKLFALMAGKKPDASESAQTERESVKPSPEGCVQIDKADPSKNIEFKVSELKDKNEKLANLVKQETGKSNPILDANPSWLEGKQLSASAEMLAFLADEKNKESGVSEGKIVAKAALDDVLNKDKGQSKSACILNVVSKDIKAESVLEIQTISDLAVDTKLRRKALDISLTIENEAKSAGVVSMKCVIAEGKYPGDEMPVIFGELLKLKKAEPPVDDSKPEEPKPEEPKPEEPKPEEPKPEEPKPAAGTAQQPQAAPQSTVVAQAEEALRIIEQNSAIQPRK